MESNLLLVDDNPGMIQFMGRVLTGLGQLRFATSGAAALKLAREQPPDLVLLDAEMPGMSGYEVCAAMKADPALREVPVIFVTGHCGAEFELMGLDLGACDFIAKPISEELLTARVKTQLRAKHLTDNLRRIASTDGLTELCNRRSFDEALAREWKRGLRAGQPCSLLMVDVDDFKRYNDRYGHPAGDGCLRAVALALRGASRRPADVVARYGGEEFALLLPQTSRAGAGHLARRVLDAVAALHIPHETARAAREVSVSVGVGCYDEDSACWAEPSADSRMSAMLVCKASDLVLAADRALYCAKRAGRARAWLLDVADVDTTLLARALGPRGAPAAAPA